MLTHPKIDGILFLIIKLTREESIMPYITGDAKTMKELNKKAILELVRRSKQISQPELSRLTGLTPATILTILEELKEKKLIIEHEPRYRPDGIVRTGRPARYFSINGDGGCVLGISIYKNLCKLSVIDYAAQQRFSSELIFPNETKPISALSAVVEEIEKLKESYDFSHIGIAVPGIIDQKTKIITHGETFLVGLPICQFIQEQCGLPTSLIHNTLALTTYEYIYEESNDTKNLIYIIINEGIGAGMVFDGKLFSGSQGIAVEIGHNFINGGGKQRILNDVSSNKAIKQRIFDRLQQESINIHYKDITSPEDLSIQLIKECYNMGDELTIHVVNEAAGYLGKAVVNLALTLNPDVVVLAGKITEADGFTETVINSIQADPSEAVKAVTSHMRIRQSQNIEETSALAAGVHALTQIGIVPDLSEGFCPGS